MRNRSNNYPNITLYNVLTMNKKTAIIQAAAFLLIMCITLSCMLREQNLADFMQKLRESDLRWILVSLLLLVAYILLEAVIIKTIMHTLEEHITIMRCCKYSFIGFFFYCISPAGSAEQPAQFGFMHRDGVNTSKSFLSLAIITLAFKLTLLVLGSFVYIMKPKAAKMIAPISPLCSLGFVLTAIAIAALVCILCIPKYVDKAASFAINALIKCRMIHDREKWASKLDEFLARYADSLNMCRAHPLMLPAVLLITIIQRICFLAITAASCRALGILQPGAFDITLAQAMISLATEMLPLPGGIGMNELAYMKVFTPAFGETALSTLIVSRGIGYYFQIFICGITSAAIYIYAMIKGGKKK